MLAERGAVVVDADQIARELVEPGRAALAALVTEFGPRSCRPDGSLNRAGWPPGVQRPPGAPSA